MDILVGKRNQGKTTHLIQMSAEGKGTIITATEEGCKYIKDQAQIMGVDIPEPTTLGTLAHLRRDIKEKGPYLLDELGTFLDNLGITTATIDSEVTIKHLSETQSHYGNELAGRIRETAKDLSRLSDFDRFVLNRGYQYETQEALQAGYDRHWKASHDILVTTEEFLAEAEKSQSVTAASTYNALVELVEANKLHPGKVYDYARYRWCLSHPEAVIACQTGRDKWSVNNCDTEITKDAALVRICEAWGFETGRIQIIGTPYYDTTDYQFIRFNCAHMTWLWQNGDLLQVYD